MPMSDVQLYSPPLGERIPKDNQHALIPSFPTWESPGALARGEQWVMERMKTGYPRFFINKVVEQLNDAVLKRFAVAESAAMTCRIFVSEHAAARFIKALRNPPSGNNLNISCARFFQPGEESVDAFWAQFYAVIYPADLSQAAYPYWRDSGDGISTRHAEFCLPRFDYLESKSAIDVLCTAPSQPITDNDQVLRLETSGKAEQDSIKQNIAKLVRSEKPDQRSVHTDDIFLYPGGMAALSAVARALDGLDIQSGVVAFGFLYAETMNVLKDYWPDLTFFRQTTEQDLDDLEALLKSGIRIKALWTDVPSSPMLTTPDLHRIRHLADTYKFLVICDESVGSFVNTDLLPYVDVLVTSLTKLYSGYCDVMGGSVVVSPQSSSHDQLHHQLTTSYEDTFFPGNLAVLHQNSQDFLERAQATNHNAKAVAEYFLDHPAVEKVQYPSMTTPDIYERYRREGGGYGALLSVIFKKPASAAHFYNTLELCKGPTFGTVFTLAIAFLQFNSVEEQENMARYGIPGHLIRISVGVEDLDMILATISRALKGVEKLEASLCLDGC